jgi:hypothetical protein
LRIPSGESISQTNPQRKRSTLETVGRISQHLSPNPGHILSLQQQLTRCPFPELHPEDRVIELLMHYTSCSIVSDLHAEQRGKSNSRVTIALANGPTSQLILAWAAWSRRVQTVKQKLYSGRLRPRVIYRSLVQQRLFHQEEW